MRNSAKKTLVLFLLVSMVLMRPIFAQEDQGESEEEQASEVAKPDESTLPPEFWYFPEEVKQELVHDQKAKDLFTEAKKKKRMRRRTGAVLFAIGATAVVGSAFVYFTAHDIGVPNDTGELVGAVGSGAGLVCFVLPGALLRGRPSKVEREYMDYMRTKYNVIPVVEMDRDQGIMAHLNLLALRF